MGHPALMRMQALIVIWRENQRDLQACTLPKLVWTVMQTWNLFVPRRFLLWRLLFSDVHTSFSLVIALRSLVNHGQSCDVSSPETFSCSHTFFFFFSVVAVCLLPPTISLFPFKPTANQCLWHQKCCVISEKFAWKLWCSLFSNRRGHNPEAGWVYASVYSWFRCWFHV